jgi:hypothetical protein
MFAFPSNINGIVKYFVDRDYLYISLAPESNTVQVYSANSFEVLKNIIVPSYKHVAQFLGYPKDHFGTELKKYMITVLHDNFHNHYTIEILDEEGGRFIGIPYCNTLYSMPIMTKDNILNGLIAVPYHDSKGKQCIKIVDYTHVISNM